jgi:hypothetical protein
LKFEPNSSVNFLTLDFFVSINKTQINFFNFFFNVFNFKIINSLIESYDLFDVLHCSARVVALGIATVHVVWRINVNAVHDHNALVRPFYVVEAFVVVVVENCCLEIIYLEKLKDEIDASEELNLRFQYGKV